MLNRARLEPLFDAGWHDLTGDERFTESREWTDDYVDILEPFFAMRSPVAGQP